MAADFLRDTPIKRKLMLVVLVSTAFALLLMGSALITYELLTFRRSLAVNMSVLAEIIGSNSTGALAFQDVKSAQEILAALSAEKQVTAAALYDGKGELFAHFPTTRPASDFPARPTADGSHFYRAHLVMFQPIRQEEARLGTIYLQADLGEMYSRFYVYGAMLLFVAACASLGAIAFTTKLQQRITGPILELAEAATAVSEGQDYSVRATPRSADEIGQLTAAFNQMLTRLGESNAALSASEERLRFALEGSQTGTWDYNLLTGRVTWDDFMYPLFRRSREEFDGTIENFLTFVHPDDLVRLDRETKDALQSKSVIDVSFRVIDFDETIRHMTSRGRAYYDDSGRAYRMSGVSMDITASKKNEAELSRAKEAAEAANQAKDNFLAILSHELRTPLTPVLAAVAMLEDDRSVPDPILRQLEMIRRNIEVEARLIDDLLDVTGIIRGKLELNRAPVDVRTLVGHARDNYCAPAAAKKNLRVTSEITATETCILADRSRMTQVFWNLLQNACKFTPPSGAIGIRVYNEAAPPASDGNSQPMLVVEISDSGIGIAPENMDRIFNAFEQGERSRTRVFGGLGLGLAISRAIVEMHGGAITVESGGENQGACFRIRLTTIPAGEIAGAGAAPAAPRDGLILQPRSLRVLLVEDHSDTAEQLTRLLKRAGHEVTWAGSIREARELLAESAEKTAERGFNILISDLGLPDGSGHDLMRDLASQQRMPGIALSGYGMKADIETSMEAGFSRHITKPVDWQELKGAIQKIAAEHSS